MKLADLFEQSTLPTGAPMGVPAAPGTLQPTATTGTAPTPQTATDPKFAAAQAATNRKQIETQRQAIMKQIADLQKQLSQLTRTV